ncbi:CHASE domain-containing protein [Pseudoduganella violaceinigra]|uniref:CHASE domain-containing protein n=1 Tax=Pseudoduganella violaceinigra TaxID=246602 RepID=UPI000A03F383|nr:CHASE domain-containing protein [Pseudoduganella violaceinigra]
MTRVQLSLLSPTKPLWWLGVVLSLGVGAGLYTVTTRSVDSEAHARFLNQARNTQFNINTSIKAYTDVLRAAASYFQAGGEVTRETFHRYVRGLDLEHNYPAIDNINFAEYYTDAMRPAAEARQAAISDNLYPAFQRHPAGVRGEYAVLTLIEPLDGFNDRYGLDIASRPGVAEALFASRDQGTMSSSGQPIPLRSTPSHIGMAIRIPIYRNDMPVRTIAERRAACVGSVGLGFSVQRLVNAALGEMPVRAVRLTLRDSNAIGNPAPLLFDSQPGMPGADGAHFITELPVQFHGRTWQAQFSVPKQALYSSFDQFLPALAGSMGFGASVLIYALFVTLASSRRRALKMARAMTRELRDSQARLQLSHHRLRRLAAHADHIKEEERKRIAREIHDDLGQNLLALRIEADILATRTAKTHPRLHARARATLHQIDNTIRSVRHIINDLRPNVLDLGLSAAVEWQIAQFRQRSGIKCEFVEDAVADHGVDDHCATAFFRVLQESLSNIHQHAGASVVRVELHQAHGMLRMTISDNGIGINTACRHKAGSFGLVGIEERISLLGGNCSISSHTHGGTTVSISVPVGYRVAPSSDLRLSA